MDGGSRRLDRSLRERGALLGTPWRSIDALDRAIIGTVLVLSCLTLAFLGVRDIRVRVVEPGVDIVIDAVTTVVTASVAALAFTRYRERDDAALYQSSAFLVSAVANAYSLLLVIGLVDADSRVGVVAPGQAPIYVSTFARLLMAALLVVGMRSAVAGPAVQQPGRRQSRIHMPQLGRGTSAALVLGLPLLAVASVAALGAGHGVDLPEISTPFTPGDAASIQDGLPVSTPLGASVQLIGAGMFLWAAALSRRLYRGSGMVTDGYLAIGLVLAAFAQANVALYPGTFPGLVTSGDLLRLAFDVVLLLGIQAAAQVYLRTLKTANENLERLRDAEADRASLEERARLSRELHDGLAQDLWLIKLTAARLAALPDRDEEEVALSAELASQVDVALADARQAVMELRLAQDEARPLCELLRRFVVDFADRFGLPTDFECEDELQWIGHRSKAELLRIVQEALTNVRRHADASRVRVRVASEDGLISVLVRDNGRGFEPGAVEAGFGLSSMRERAALIGGRITVDSRPDDGTRVLVEVPYEPLDPLLAT
jgi:signal transduction histidine kinase